MMKCSVCGGTYIIRKGFDEGGNQRYRCKSRLQDGSLCGSWKRPIFFEEGEESELEDVRDESILLAKKLQRQQDKTRIERKAFRDNTKIENAVIEYSKALRDVVKESQFKIDPKTVVTRRHTSGSIGIVHLTDLHFNELVDIIGNKYDFRVASQRLKSFAGKIKSMFDGRRITQVYIVMTGDLLNSDRRTDEKLSQATNRAQATFISVNILAQFIIDLAMSYDVKVVSVTGNESRINEEYTHIDTLATDNFDFMIYEMLKIMLEGNDPYIEFISGNTFEYILSINGTNILVTHGNRLGRMAHTDLSKAITKWSKRNIIIHNIMCGHLHECNITDTLLRSGSLVGNNAYADVGLNFNSLASQNIYMVDKYGSLDSTRVDLQRLGNKPAMYPIDEELEAYNAKSVDKIKQTTTVLKIVT